MKRSAHQKAIIFGGIAACATVIFMANRPARAQGVSRPEGDGEMHFETKIGSFKLLGTDGDVTGRLEMTGKGTVLVSGIAAAPKTTGALKLEYTYAPYKQYCYHGAGTMVLQGPFRNVQWFGNDLTAYFKGRGKLRLSGEFDKNLNTGFYWTNDPKDKEYWPANNVGELVIPPFGPDAKGPIKTVPFKGK